jgi:hypothetical protein
MECAGCEELLEFGVLTRFGLSGEVWRRGGVSAKSEEIFIEFYREIYLVFLERSLQRLL